MKKRILSVIAAFIMLLTLLPTTAMAAGEFTDVRPGDYFAASVEWAVDAGITLGTSDTTFSPNLTCTRAEIITFLWRAAGCPEVRGYVCSPYFDVAETDYYYMSAAWAAEAGIVDIEGVFFEPDTPCTRAATVEYIWRYAKSPSAAAVSFSDVTAGTDTAQAVSWTVDYGVTKGTGGTTFSPKSTCTRAEIVTFLYRYFVEPLTDTYVPTPDPIPAPSVNVGELDPLPPADYKKHADWYISLTSVGEMSNARLVAESDSIAAVIADYRARDAFITDSIYIRRDDIRYQIMERAETVRQYDEAVSQKQKYGWEIPDYILEDYEDLIAKWGDPEPLRDR